MSTGQRVAIGVTLVALAAIAGFMAYQLGRPSSAVQETTPLAPASELEWIIQKATRSALPASGYMLYVQESEKCNGAAVIKYSEADWTLGLAWYDARSGELTDVVKREELVESLSPYITVDEDGLEGVRDTSEGTPEMYVGMIGSSAESVWLQLDPDSCGVRSGWLVYRQLPNGPVTRQKVGW